MSSDSSSDTVQTGHPAPLRKPFFEVAQDDQGQWHWCLWSSNGRQLAVNANSFPRRSDCTNSIIALKNSVGPECTIAVAHKPKERVRPRKDRQGEPEE